MTTLQRFLSVAALVVVFSAVAAADTLELKDGRTLQGKYLGGTQVLIRFEVDGDVQTFRVTEVRSVGFERRRDRDRDRQDRQDDGMGAPPRDQSGPNDPPPSRDQAGTYDAPPPPPDQQSRPNDYPPPPPDPRDRVDDRDTRNRDAARDSGRNGDDRDRSRERDQDRDDRDFRGAQPVYAAPGTNITVPAGQTMLVRMIDGVDSKHNEVGDVFHASLETDVVVNNVLVARRGSDVYGRLAYAKEAGHFSGSSELQLELTRLMIDGREFPVVSGDYTLKGKGRGGDTAKKVGGGAAAGAVIGAIAGGGAGAAIGAGVGSAVGVGAQVFTRGHEVRVPSETLLEFRLDQPVNVIPTQK